MTVVQIVGAALFCLESGMSAKKAHVAGTEWVIWIKWGLSF